MKNGAERKIETALKEAAGYHRNGMGASDAVAKAASLNNLNPDMTHRVIEAFNIAKTNATIPKLSDKTASFDQAIAEDVMDKVFKGPIRPKSALAEPKDGSIEDWMTGGSDLLEVAQNNIAVNWTGNEKVASSPEDLANLVKQANGAIHSLAAELSQAAQQVQFLEEKAFQQMKVAVDHFATTNNLGTWAQFEAEIHSEWGKEASCTTLDIIFDLSKLAHHKEPRFIGEIKVASAHIVPTPAHRAFDSLMNETGAYHGATAAYNKLAAELEEKKSELDSLMRESAGLAPKEAAVTTAADLLNSGSKKKTADLNLELPQNSLVSAAQSGVASGISSQYGKAHEKALELRYKGPKDQVDAEIDNVRRSAVLQELMANDEIISKMDPQDVQKHYNTLLGIAPDLTTHPSLVSSFIRQAGANQAIDPFTAQQLATLQGQHTKNKMLASGKVPQPGM